MEIKLKIEGLDTLAGALSSLANAIAYKKGDKSIEVTDEVKDVAKLVEDKQKEIKDESKPKIEKETIKENSKDKEETEKEKISDSDLTIEDVRAAFMAKNSKTNTPKLKALLKEFKVAKVTDLEEKDFEAVLKALEEI